MTTIDFDSIKKFGAQIPDLGAPLPSLAAQFGVPVCVLSFTKAFLSLLPGDLLGNLSNGLETGKEFANDKVRGFLRKAFRESGLMEFVTGSGAYRYLSDTSRDGLDKDQQDFLSQLMNWVGLATGFLNELVDIADDYKDDIEDFIGCMEDIGNFLGVIESGGNINIAFTKEDNASRNFALATLQVNSAKDFIEKADNTLSIISEVMYERETGIAKEPAIDEVFIIDDLDTWVSSNLPVSTGEEDKLLEVFDLVYGPPRSKKGQFLLSIDGLYYDAQEGGIPFFDIDKEEFIPSSLIPDASSGEMWEFKYNPNLGGKGIIFTKNDLTQFVSTLFDDTKIDNSLQANMEYKADHLLQLLIGQKNKHINDVESQIAGYIASGYVEGGAVVRNIKQNLISIAVEHDAKINKRKKQIQIAWKAQHFAGENLTYRRGEVPVNDFSFLRSYHLTPTKAEQERLMFRQGEVSGVVLPLQNNFVVASETEGAVVLENLLVPPVGAGTILDSGAVSGDTSTVTTVANLTDSVITDQIIGAYNFLETNIVDSSGKYETLNCANIHPPAETDASKGVYGNARMVADSSLGASSVFRKGLSIPYLQGLRKLSSADGTPSSIGSYLDLPNIPPFQDFTYLDAGCTFEFWAHIPDYSTVQATPYADTGWGTSSYNKVMLGCENIGGTVPDTLVEDRYTQYDAGSEIVRGMLLGFSRDRQVAHDEFPSNATADNSLDDHSVFFLAPTQSVNASSIAFTQYVEDEDYFASKIKINKCAVDTSSTVSSFDLRGDIAFSGVENEFMHIGISVNPAENLVTLTLDGNEFTTCSVTRVFGGGSVWQPPDLPTLTQGNSFTYEDDGPTFEPGNGIDAFTPWILGGGYTDGYYKYGNTDLSVGEGGFMGKYHGLGSGLNGYVGSIKFYSKALTTSEIQKNYTNQKGFFKNIDLT